jgi:hypothetical protein
MVPSLAFSTQQSAFSQIRFLATLSFRTTFGGEESAVRLAIRESRFFMAKAIRNDKVLADC